MRRHLRAPVTLAFAVMLASLVAPSVTARPAASSSPADLSFAPDRVLVGFEPGTTLKQTRDAISRAGASGDRVIGAGTHVVAVPAGTVTTVIAALQADPVVRYAEPDYYV